VLRQEMEAWAGCLAGALEEDVYRQLLAAAGFTDIDIEVTRRYTLDDLGKGETRALVEKLLADQQHEVEGTFVSAFIRARKP